MDGIRSLAPDDHGFLRTVSDAYLDTAADLVEALHDAIEESSPEALSTVAHSLKSSSANIGALGLADTCRQLEDLGRGGSTAGAAELLDNLEVEFARVVAELHDETH